MLLTALFPAAYVLASLGAPPPARAGDERAWAEDVRREVLELARLHDGTATAENVARSRRLRALIGSVVARGRSASQGAAGDARDAEERGAATRIAARALLDDLLCTRGGLVAMETVLALIDERSLWSLQLVAERLPAMESGVARRALDWLEARGVEAASVGPELRRALERLTDTEARCSTARLLGGATAPENARALLAAAPKPREPTSARERRRAASDERFAAALVEALVRQGAAVCAPLVREAIAAEAEGAVRAPADAGRVIIAARVAERLVLRDARDELEQVVVAGAAGASDAALTALVAIDLAPSRERLADALQRGVLPADLAARVAAALDREAGASDPERVLALACEDSWQCRTAAAAQLAHFPASNAALERLLALTDRDPNRTTRRAAFAALRAMRRPEAVPHMIARLAPLAGRDPDLTLDFLRWASGRPSAARDNDWSAWWESVREGFEYPPEEEATGSEAETETAVRDQRS